MNTELIKRNNKTMAVIQSDEVIIFDSGSALDIIAGANYEHKADAVAINKSAIDENFFKLSTGLAGEILQKFVNYNMKFAVVGDFSKYTSKPLKDFIYESNKGKTIVFVETNEQAADMLL